MKGIRRPNGPRCLSLLKLTHGHMVMFKMPGSVTMINAIAQFGASNERSLRGMIAGLSDSMT